MSHISAYCDQDPVLFHVFSYILKVSNCHVQCVQDLIFCQDFQPGLLDINQKHIFNDVLIYIYLMFKVICDHLSVFQHMESGNNRFQLHAVRKDCVFTRHNVVYWVLIITN